MRRIQKYFYLIILSAFLMLTVVMLPKLSGVQRPQLALAVEEAPEFLAWNPDGSRSERVTIYDAGDGNCYVFLPSFAQLDRVTVTAGKGQAYTLDGAELTEGLNCASFRLDTPYAFTADGVHIADLWFRRSENIPAMYIDTVSGSLEGILHDTFPEELAGARVYTAEGKLDHLEDYASIKCRGYSSWIFEKKSYTLSLGKSVGLLGMGNSGKWTLTANGFDAAKLRNKTVYSFADAVSEIPAWAPDCTYTELYLNREYAGLYLLCQKLDEGPDHLDLAPEDYYFEMMPSIRYRQSAAEFLVGSARSVEILSPENCDTERKDYLQNRLAEFRAALLAEEGTAWQAYIDMDSWARKYLIEEVFSNSDAGRASQFFWLDETDGKIYAGPCWDYDISFGLTFEDVWDSTYSLMAQRDWDEEISWFHALCQKEEFMDAVIRIYETEFRPLMQEYAESTIGGFAKDIRSVIASESLRWPDLCSEEAWEAAVGSMSTFLRERIAFLDSIWLNKAAYHTITIREYNVCIPAGATCETRLQLGKSGQDVWYLAGTDIPFDVTQPVTCDITLSAVPASEIPPETQPEDAAEKAAGFTTQEYITFLSIAALGVLLLGFAGVDFFRRRKERRNADADRRTEVSP